MRIIPAIETVFSGCRFRSRLEARWALFFNELNVAWRYEPEGFRIKTSSCQLVEPTREATAKELHNIFTNGLNPADTRCPTGCRHHINYLPDFYLPESGTWVEVKGDVTRFDKELLATMVDGGSPLPGIPDSLGTSRGLLLLGDVPVVEEDGPLPIHPILQHHEGGYVNNATWYITTKTRSGSLRVSQRGTSRWPHNMEHVFDGSCGPESLDEGGCWEYIEKFWAPYRPMFWDGTKWAGDGTPPMWWAGSCNEQVARAYQKARQARFEHGQKG